MTGTPRSRSSPSESPPTCLPRCSPIIALTSGGGRRVGATASPVFKIRQKAAREEGGGGGERAGSGASRSRAAEGAPLAARLIPKAESR
ncbi:Hypothetical predicted protein [Podarcis lilfordi]|uniref:Uncharacterized protein n=1 Tax=Podarcis lilfordi TaxID=74358 RepID=A0AA35KX50_9SAUR|nr:Hypothetical predicted protein [Podarcis lilfordi]